MTDRAGAARRRDDGERDGGERDGERPDALAYWYLQESTPLGAADPPAEPAPEDPRMASGWWLLPAVLLSVPAWVALGRLLFGGP